MSAARRAAPPALFDLFTDAELDIRRVQPYQATKAYVCPGCNGPVATGVGHVVVVPLPAPDLRRHWHHGCWSHRHTRR